MPDLDLEPGKNEANAAIWAGVGGILGALAGALVVFSPWRDENTVIHSFSTAVGAGAFWGWVLAEIRNWLGRRGR